MSGFLSAQNIFVKQQFDSREDMLRFIAEQAVKLGIGQDAEAIFDAFIERESIGETGMTDGFAVPHAKTAAIQNPAAIVVKNTTKLDWPSFDEQPIDIAIALMVPEQDAGTTHIRLLSKTAVLLMDDDFKALVRKTDDPQQIANAINEGIENV